MSTAATDGGSVAGPVESRKRLAELDDDESPSKRQRIEALSIILTTEKVGTSPHVSKVPTTDAIAKAGLQRGIALALKKVGFDTATPLAMESFVALTEKYLERLVQDIKRYSNAARRTHPVPRDFEQGLKRHNLTTTALEPHKRNPISKSRRIPIFEALSLTDEIGSDLPILGDDLDGSADKRSKPYIPSSFPDFPSVHTYKYTPQMIEPAIIPDEWDTLNSIPAPSQPVKGAEPQPKPQRPLAPEEIPHGDPKKMREAAAKEAKAGENALRQLMRASKIAKQKEVWTSAQHQPARRERYNLWESAMRELLEDDTRAKGQELAPAAMHGEKGRFEIADHSMIVNTEKAYHRHEVPRAGARKIVTSTQTVPSKV